MEYIPLITNLLLAAAVICGIVLTIIGLPGNFLILIAAIMYGWQENFLHVTYATLLLLAAIWGSAELLEFIAGLIGAKKQQSSRWTMLAAIIGSLAGGILGTGMLPLMGTILGALFGGFIMSFTVEYIHTKDKEKAGLVAKAVVKGQLTGMLIKFVAALCMAGVILYKLYY